MERHSQSPEIDPKRAKRRARWQRNKQNERARTKEPQPEPLDSKIVEQVWLERDRRLAHFPGWLWIVPEWHYGRGSEAFQCDVWAVRTLLELQHHPRKISHGMIARWMDENKLAHGYAHGEKSSSLRTMIGRALAAIKILETTTTKLSKNPAWPAFIPSPSTAVENSLTES